MSWNLVYTRQAQKDARNLASSNLRDKAKALLDVIEDNPFQNPPIRKINRRFRWRVFTANQYSTPSCVSSN